MPYTLDLTGAWAKLNRAKVHVNTLRADIDRQGYPDAKGVNVEHARVIRLRKQFEPKQGAIVYRIDGLIEIGNDWGLIVGDAVHNMRCALDHLAWQLALRKFNGVAPTDRRIIKEIQFPVVVNKNDWPTHINRKHMEPADADKLEKFQPFNLGPIARANRSLHPLEQLAGFGGLDNVDKHRAIELTYLAAHQVTFYNDPNVVFTDCMPVLMDTALQTFITTPGRPPNVGDEILRVLVTATGPHPDVNFEPRLTGYIAIRETWDALYALDTMTEGVATILKAF